MILRPDGARFVDVRPMTRANVSVIVEEGDRRETGSAGSGGRRGYGALASAEGLQELTREALRQALVNLSAEEAPAGAMPVALGPGWCGVLLHEAVGHGLEGDFNRKKTSAFAGLMGEMVAAKGVTVVDDGSLPGRRGSLSIDDEGVPPGSHRVDRRRPPGRLHAGSADARLMVSAAAPMAGPPATAGAKLRACPDAAHDQHLYARRRIRARRGDHRAQGRDLRDLVRRRPGRHHQREVRLHLHRGLSGQERQDPPPVKGATLIGDGPSAMRKIRMIGNDMQIDPGIGTCGKNGQGVPVTVGQPTLLMEGLTIAKRRMTIGCRAVVAFSAPH